MTELEKIQEIHKAAYIQNGQLYLSEITQADLNKVESIFTGKIIHVKKIIGVFFA